MNIQFFTEHEKQKEAYRRLRVIIDNKNLRDRQARIYEVINTFNIDISGTNMEKLIIAAGLKTYSNN